MINSDSSWRTRAGQINGIQATASDKVRAVDVGLFIGEEWQGSIPLHRAKALELYRDLEGAIGAFWPHAIAPSASSERMAALADALEAALTLLEVHLEAQLISESDEVKAQTESLLEEMRAALTAGDEFEALRDIRDLHAERAIEGSEYEDVVHVALDALRRAGRRH
jgi:hypothetical protein